MSDSKTVIGLLVAVPLLLLTTLFVAIGTEIGGNCGTAAGGPSGVGVAGLSEQQLRLARDGVAIGRQRGAPVNTIIAELAAQATESGFRNLANPNVPDSLSHPNDGLGYDHDSVGPHQMRESVWGAVGVSKLMDPIHQINWFYDQAAKLGARVADLGPAELAQAVERSAPNVYARNLSLAREVYSRIAAALPFGPGIGCAAAHNSPAGTGQFGQDVIAAAQRWIGTPYSWGAGDVRGPSPGREGIGFDCSGLVLHAVHVASQGRITLPHYTQWQQDHPAGKVIAFADRRPGDIMYFTAGGGDSHHTGIYLRGPDGRDMLLNAPTFKVPVRIQPLSDWAGERIDVRRFG